MRKQKLSRRNFLRSAAVATIAGPAGGRVGGREPEPAKQDCGSVWQQPDSQQGNDLNLIVIVSDTFRRDNLRCYGSRWVDCPRLNEFAKEAIVLDDFYPEGMPTLVIRRTLYTGRRTVPCHYYRQHERVQLPGWHNLYNEDVTLSETLSQAGYITSLISDIPHQQRPGRNFHRGFGVYQWIRGQENDYYGTSPHKLLDVHDMVSDAYLARLPSLHAFLSQYKANRELWIQDGESLAEIVARTGMRWLKANHAERPFYLHVEAFDPHEPWDPPPRFLEKYLPGASGPSYVEPPYDTFPLSEEIRQRFRANYAAESSCVDYWIGELLDLIRKLGLLENSIVVFLSDHGTMLGEQGQFLKGPERLRGQVTHVPLLIRLPGQQGGRHVAGFVQMQDVMPTLLGLLGLKPPSRVTGNNFWPLVTGETRKLYDHVVQTFGWVGAVRTGEWNYSQTWKAEAPQDPYTPQLYNLDKDPEELNNVAEKYPDVAKQLAAKLKEYVSSGEVITRGSFHETESLNSTGVYLKMSR